jgi:hypothetical protein
VVIEFDGLEDVPLPSALVAYTVNVYVVDKLSPVTRIGEDAPVAVIPPGLETAV